LFDANCNLIQDEAPSASLVNCRIARGISLHIYLPDGKVGGWNRYASCRTSAEDTDDEIDHLVIAGTRDSLDEHAISKLILEWLRIPKDDHKARQKLTDSFSIKRKGKRAAS
jgi:hypothetical protein